MLLMARPDLLEERPGWDTALPNTRSIRLQGLEPRECEALLLDRAGGLKFSRETVTVS